MNTFSFTHEGKTYTNFTREEALDAGVPQDVVDAELIKLKAIEQRQKVRGVIKRDVGDTASLLGTVADGQSILVAVALSDIVALSTATDFAKYKKARLDALKALSGDADLLAIAGEALAKIKSGDVILTASLKGLEATIAETLERSTGVANAMILAAKDQ
jgi:hypothetical protein